MVHIVAVLLTLVPGFGLGHLLLGKIREFVFLLLVGVFLSSFYVAIKIFADPPLITRPFYPGTPSMPWEVFLLTPLLVWNIYCAHRLWMEDSDVDLEETSGQTRFPSALGPIMFIALIALAALLGIQNWSLWFPVEPKGLGEIRLEQVEAKLDKHDLTFIDQDKGRHTRVYEVEPGNYTLTVFTYSRHQYGDVLYGVGARRNSTDHFVYAQGFDIYVLETQSEDAISRFVADLAEHLPVNCVDGEDGGVCRLAP